MSKNVESGYNAWADSYDAMPNKTRDADALALQTILATINLTKVLEAGCGTGKNTTWLAEKAMQVTAMDFSEAMLQQARAKVAAANVTFVQADLKQVWPFARQAFDAVTCNLVLEHIEDLLPVMKEAARVLKSGGHLFVCELHPYKQYGGSKARFETAAGTQVLECYVHHASDYFRAATAAGLQCLRLDEWFDDNNREKPRLLSFLFQKGEAKV